MHKGLYKTLSIKGIPLPSYDQNAMKIGCNCVCWQIVKAIFSCKLTCAFPDHNTEYGAAKFSQAMTNIILNTIKSNINSKKINYENQNHPHPPGFCPGCRSV